MDVHLDGISFMDENLLQQHASDFACLDVGVWHKVSFWSVCAGPAETEAFFF
jgi:hypothetical protein